MTFLLVMRIRQAILRRVYLVLRTRIDEANRQRLSPKLYGNYSSSKWACFGRH